MRTLLAIIAVGIATSPTLAGDLLPLKRGVYFETTYDCARAPYMQASVWNGREFTSSRGFEKISSAKSTKAIVATYVYDDNGGRHRQGGGSVTVTGPKSYMFQNDFGRFEYRWCGSNIDDFM